MNEICAIRIVSCSLQDPTLVICFLAWITGGTGALVALVLLDKQRVVLTSRKSYYLIMTHLAYHKRTIIIQRLLINKRGHVN